MAEITVIIPSYQRYISLCQAIDSVLWQSFRDFELLVIDDASSPSPEIMITRRYAHEKRLRFLSLKHHLGYAGAVRNVGIRESDSRFIAFLDSDDLWLADKLELQMKQQGRLRHCREKWWRYSWNLEQSRENLALSEVVKKQEKGIKEISQATQKHARSGHLFSSSLKKCVIGPSTVLIERELFEECGLFREDLVIAEDYELWLRLSSVCQVSYLEQQLVIKRDQGDKGNQLSHRYSFIELFRLQALHKLLEEDFLAAPLWDKAYKEYLNKLAIWSHGAKKRCRFEEIELWEKRAASLKKDRL